MSKSRTQVTGTGEASVEGRPAASGLEERLAASGLVEERPAGTRRRTMLAIAAVSALVLGGGWWITQPAQEGGAATASVNVPGAAAAPRVGDVAPDFTATTTDGRTLTLSSLRGRPVWLTFGASWCAPCRVEAPDIQAAHAASGERGVQVVAVYLGEDAAAVKSFASTLGLTYTHVPDPEQKLAAAWGVRGIPVHWFIGADGTVTATQAGIVGPERIRALTGGLG